MNNEEKTQKRFNMFLDFLFLSLVTLFLFVLLGIITG